MGNYRLSTLCDQDLTNIFEFGIKQFGLNQAQTYLLDLHNIFDTLAEQSFIGQDASEIAPGLKRLIYKSHMVFYFSTDYGAHILRVLHQSMDYQRHLRH